MEADAVDGAEPHEADEAAATAGAPEMASGGVRVRDPMLAVGVLSEGPNGPFASRLTSEEQPARKTAVAPAAESRNTLRTRVLRFSSPITQNPHSTQLSKALSAGVG